MSDTIDIHECAGVKVKCKDNEWRKTMVCYISDADINDDGTISWPPTGTCNKTGLTH